MSSLILPVAVGVPAVFRQPLNCSFLTQPGVGGSMLLEYSNDGANWTSAPDGLATVPYAFCPNSFGVAQLGFVRATAATAAGSVIQGDLTQLIGSGYERQTFMASGVAYTMVASSTAEARLLSVKVPAGILQRNFRIEIDAAFTCTNNANVKTLRAYAGNSNNNGALPTIYATQVLTSSSGGRAQFIISSRNDGATLIGGSIGSALGFGISTTAPIAISSLASYLTAEQEFVVTGQKATGTDTVTLDQFVVKVFQ
jgi:hypothetical protein